MRSSTDPDNPPPNPIAPDTGPAASARSPCRAATGNTNNPTTNAADTTNDNDRRNRFTSAGLDLGEGNVGDGNEDAVGHQIRVHAVT